MPTSGGSKKFGVVLIVVLVCLAVLGIFLAMDIRNQRWAEATRLARQYLSNTSMLERVQQKCGSEDECCLDRSALQRRNLELEFKLECHLKLGKAACDRALVNLPEFDTAGVI